MSKVQAFVYNFDMINDTPYLPDVKLMPYTVDIDKRLWECADKHDCLKCANQGNCRSLWDKTCTTSDFNQQRVYRDQKQKIKSIENTFRGYSPDVQGQLSE